MAPSWANRQCWSFVVVKDRKTIKLLTTTAGVTNTWLKKASIIIFACGDPKWSGSKDGIEYFVVDLAIISIQHLNLAVADIGPGGCWGVAFDKARVKEVWGIPENIWIIAYPAE